MDVDKVPSVLNVKRLPVKSYWSTGALNEPLAVDPVIPPVRKITVNATFNRGDVTSLSTAWMHRE
jgi:hypothetical protein